MIDLENDVFTAVATALRNNHSGIYVVGKFIETPARLPAVTIMEADNRILERMSSSSGIENAVSVMYECNVFSNKSNGKKTQAKEITNTMDAAFEEIGFTRTFREQIPNLKDATIYRIVCRYEAVIDKDFWIYQS